MSRPNHWNVSSTFQIAQILALEATEPVSEPVAQMAVELTDKHSSHFSTAKEIGVKAAFFFM